MKAYLKVLNKNLENITGTNSQPTFFHIACINIFMSQQRDSQVFPYPL